VTIRRLRVRSVGRRDNACLLSWCYCCGGCLLDRPLLMSRQHSSKVSAFLVLLLVGSDPTYREISIVKLLQLFRVSVVSDPGPLASNADDDRQGSSNICHAGGLSIRGGAGSYHKGRLTRHVQCLRRYMDGGLWILRRRYSRHKVGDCWSPEELP
jgi:hypothetical protein